MNKYANRDGSRRKNPRKERYQREALDRMDEKIMQAMQETARRTDEAFERLITDMAGARKETQQARVH